VEADASAPLFARVFPSALSLHIVNTAAWVAAMTSSGNSGPAVSWLLLQALAVGGVALRDHHFEGPQDAQVRISLCGSAACREEIPAWLRHARLPGRDPSVPPPSL
jgi:hypothetical protein